MLKHSPSWTDVNMLKKKTRLCASSGNLHGLKDEDYVNMSWPLPRMFGAERYAFTIVDITDPRYAAEAKEMTLKLTRMFYDYQMLDLTWRRCFQALQSAERSRASLPAAATQKARERADLLISNCKNELLDIQDQRDQVEKNVKAVWTRCSLIKSAIAKESSLEALRKEMAEKVRRKFESQGITMPRFSLKMQEN